MKRLITLFVLVGLFVAQTMSLQAAPQIAAKDKPDAPAQGKLIPDQYIVVLKEGADAQAIADALGVKAKHVYKAAIKGFTAKLNANQLDALRANALVDFVEQDQEVTLSATQYSPTWGLDRIDQRYLPLSGSYTYSNGGAGVTAYVIDSGIESSHPEFGGRAYNVYDAFGGNGEDCNGHGTHVAGTIGGATYGVAKDVQLRGVRVFGCSGGSAWSTIIAGIDWVRYYGQRPAVANLSLSGGASSAVDSAVNSLANSGIFTAVAAGNSGANACNYSPARASAVLAVAASDSSDYRAWFSNHGSCVDLYAPGVAVTSAWLYGGTNTIEGTSMASPHVAGVAAQYKSLYGDYASSTINSWIIGNTTSGVIYGNRSGTVNRLLATPDVPAPPVYEPPPCQSCDIP